MGLRQKLFLGFAGFLAIIAAIGIHNIARISALGRSIDVILRENYRSVLACQEMKEVLDRMDGGALLLVLGHEKEGVGLIDGNEALFERALSVELGNVTLPGERERAERLKELFDRYRPALARVRDPSAAPGARRRAYFSELHPLYGRIRSTADDILRMNQEAMAASDLRARRQAAVTLRQMSLMLLAATAVAAALLFLTGKWILRPIKRLKSSAEEIERGNLDLIIESGSRDEIGQLSEAFNEMAASLREFRRGSAARLNRVQKALQQAFDSLPDAIAVLSPDGRVEVSTEAARESFGLRPGIAVGELPHPWMTGLLHEALQGAPRPADGQGDSAAVQRFVGGQERFYHPKAVPILDSERQPAGVVLILQDITALRREDELKKGAISTVSHQLKTPLTSVRMALHLLLEEKIGSLTEKQAELLVAAREDADRLHLILEDLLDISRIGSGKAAMECRPVPPAELVRESVEPYRSEAKTRGVTLTVDVPADLPTVWVDTGRIVHVFANLLSNALRHTPAGGRVAVSGRTDEDGVRFAVADTGTGIPEEHIPRIFDPFFRVPDRDQGREDGVGLGLSIAREIVEAHGGTIDVRSREGEGSVFTFTLGRADRRPEEELEG